MNPFEPDNLIAIGTTLSVLLGSGVIAAIINKRVPKHTQLLEVLQDIQEERDKDSSKLQSLEERIDTMERKQRIRDDYIAILRMHISNELPPPPPEWPEELR